VVKERRATFRQDPGEVARRPGNRTVAANLALAGDWTDTGLPATIEGAILSGSLAAGTLPRAQGMAPFRIRPGLAPVSGISEGA
jgi:uncharacterized protein with NAD-binding domain and iron-sulfur cluster